jgi:hypothetical protein
MYKKKNHDHTARERLRKMQQQCKALAASLSECWPVYNGTVTIQTRTCGQPTCACHRDESKRHGPYATWTTKVKGKTIARRLSPEEAEVVGGWIENRRRLNRTTKEMVALCREMLPLILETLGQEGE